MRLQKLANVLELATNLIRYNYYNQCLFMVKKIGTLKPTQVS